MSGIVNLPRARRREAHYVAYVHIACKRFSLRAPDALSGTSRHTRVRVCVCVRAPTRKCGLRNGASRPPRTFPATVVPLSRAQQAPLLLPRRDFPTEKADEPEKESERERDGEAHKRSKVIERMAKVRSLKRR
jgi:hypothetical protein